MKNYNPAIRYGVIMGVIGIVLFLAVWALAPDQMKSGAYRTTQFVLFFLALPIVMQVLAARDVKPNFEDYGYGQAFKAAFLVGAVAMLLNILFNLVFFLIIDPGYMERMMEISKDATLSALEDRNMTDEEIDKAMAMNEPFLRFFSSIKGSIVMSLVMVGWYAILASLVAIVHRKPKEA